MGGGCNNNNNNDSNFVTLVRERIIPIERPPLVDEVSANFRGFVFMYFCVL
jgi:hypothetical protein